MKIALDVSQINRDGAGINNYLKGILSGFTKIKEHEFVLCMRRDENLEFELPANFEKLVLPSVPWWSGGGIRWYFNLGQQLRRRKVDILISPTMNFSPLFFPTAMIVHDLAPVTHPETFTWSLKLRFNLSLFLTRYFARQVLAVTETTKKELLKVFPRYEKQIAVTDEGLAAWTKVPQSQARETEVNQKYQLPEKYIFSLGTLQPRKNYKRAIQAFARLIDPENPANLPEHTQQMCTNLHYIIGGGRGWKYKQVFEEVEKLELQDKVKFIGFIDEPDLPHIFDTAQGFVQVSLEEGFGLPIIEARSRGLNLLLSKIPVFQELNLDISPIWVDPKLVPQITIGMAKLIHAEKSSPSISLLQQYDWNKVAEKIVSSLK